MRNARTCQIYCKSKGKLPTKDIKFVQWFVELKNNYRIFVFYLPSPSPSRKWIFWTTFCQAVQLTKQMGIGAIDPFIWKNALNGRFCLIWPIVTFTSTGMDPSSWLCYHGDDLNYYNSGKQRCWFSIMQDWTGKSSCHPDGLAYILAFMSLRLQGPAPILDCNMWNYWLCGSKPMWA